MEQSPAFVARELQAFAADRGVFVANSLLRLVANRRCRVHGGA
jgi:hypothetical protein